MAKYTHLLFDLDGTLTDSEEGIINSMRYALGHFGINEDDFARLRSFIGPPLLKSFRRTYSFSEKEAKEAASYYRSYFSEKGIFENRLYPGVRELLRDLKKDRKILIMATSKRGVFAERITDHFELRPYFDLVVGGSPDGKISEKTDIIRHVFSIVGEEMKKTSVMIGDRKYDIIGARENGIDSVAVLYGYGTDEEIDAANPSHRAASIEELRSLLLT